MSKPSSPAGKPENPPARGRGRPPSLTRRAEMLDMAAGMFAREGYHGTSMRDLAERAGINVASLYHYFQSKEEALFEVCLAGAQQSERRIERIAAQRGDMNSRLASIMSEHIADLEIHSDYRHVYFEQRRMLGAQQLAVIDQVSRRVRLLLTTLFTEAEAAGDLHADLSPRQAVFVFVAGLRALTQYYVDGPVREYPVVAQGIADTLLRGLSNRKVD